LGSAAEGTDLEPVARLAADRCWSRASVLVDRELVVRWASPSISFLLGWSSERVRGVPVFEFVHPDDHATVAETMAFESVVDPSARLSLRQRNVREVRFRSQDGGDRTLEVALTNFYDDPEIGMILVDVAELTQFRTVNRSIEFTRMGTGISSVLSVVLTQFTSSEAGQPAAAIFDRGGAIVLATANAPVPFGTEPTALYRHVRERELIEDTTQGSLGFARFWTVIETPNPFDIDASEVVARQSAIAVANQRATEELQRAALLDPLTGLGNRRALEQDLRARLDRGEEVLVVYLDLDGFKAINDRMGHAAGDEVLQAVATRLTSSLRQTDLAARVGGDEFVLLLGPTAPPVAVMTDRLMMAISAPIFVNNEAVDISASIGFGSGSADAAVLLSLADRAMLASKHAR
jgi:diguanylate cyclase (GGDEF)-like protein/PAS domain S-box-containing protein